KNEHYDAPRLEIGEKMMASGNAGCNNFFGQAELKDNRLRIEKMGMTMKMCIGDVMDTEQAVSQSLMDWNDVTLTKDTLTLKNDVHTLTFTLREWVN
ncbi:META domain-containing protein, partial [Vibrio fluvialis]|nr:META domain-containing protein [Vibrio fluvialis]